MSRLLLLAGMLAGMLEQQLAGKNKTRIHSDKAVGSYTGSTGPVFEKSHVQLLLIT